jgi:hypothetical protein
MATFAPERPKAVTVVGWGSIVLAVLMFLGGVAGVAGYAVMNLTANQASSGLPPGFEQMTEIYQRTIPLSFLQLGIAVVMLVGSILLLRLQETGRLILEALNWFGVVYTIAVSAWFMPNLSRTMARAAETMPGSAGRGPAMPSLAISVAIGAVQLVIIGIIIWVLRSKTVREAMLPDNAASPPVPPEAPHA